MMLNPSLGDISSSDVDIIHVQDQQVQQVHPEFDVAAWEIVSYQPLVLQPPPIHVGIAVPFGLVPPPNMVWEIAFQSMLHQILLQSIPSGLQQLPLPPLSRPSGDWVKMLQSEQAPLLIELPTVE